jgi:hypothetical protein
VSNSVIHWNDLKQEMRNKCKTKGHADLLLCHKKFYLLLMCYLNKFNKISAQLGKCVFQYVCVSFFRTIRWILMKHGIRCFNIEL